MSEHYYLGLDLGTGSIKTVIFDQDGKEVGIASEEYPVYSPNNGWSEQETKDWYNAAMRTMKKALDESGIDRSKVKGLGFSGQMMGLVNLDEDGNALRRAILWNDARTTQACEEVREIVGDDVFMKYALNPARPGLTAAKIQWVKSNQPEIYEKTKHMLLPKDYLRYRLTGDYATEVTDASATQLLDVPNRKWAKEILDLMEIDEEVLPKVYESAEITGYLKPEIAEELGLPNDVAVVGGAADNAAAAVGVGVVSPGRALTTIGTSGTVVAVSNEPLVDEKQRVYTLCMTSPDTWHFMGSVNSAGNSLKWFRNNFYPEDLEYEQINEDAVASGPGAHNLIYMPYLTGEQSPHFDLNARASFVGLSWNHDIKDMTRAVMEGITYALRDILTAVRESGEEPDAVRMCGGGSKSEFWRQLMADIYGLPVLLPDMNSENAGALGAAILAMVGTGEYDSVEEACDHIIKMREEEYKPDEKLHEKYNEFYEAFDRLYPNMKENFKEILNIETE